MIRFSLIALCFGLLSATNCALTSANEPDTNWQFTDIEGNLHEPFKEESTRGIVLVFISIDCPIANSYQPLLRRLDTKYSKNGIRFFMVHPHPERTIDEARKHADDFGIEAPVVVDAKQSISTRVGATVTPEAFVFIRNQTDSVYQGRIDDRYAGYGKKRNVPTTNELADALDAVVAGRLPQTPKTEAVGCFISYEK